MARIVRTTLARADLRDIWLYIAHDSMDAADRFLDRIDQTIQMLAENPGIGECQDELRQGLRRHVLGNYLVFYEPMRDGVRVIRVLHGAQRWEDAFG
jgi:toxin ParE1/3/4